MEFEVAFPNEKPKTVKDYLVGGDREMILNAAAFLLGFRNQNSLFDDPGEALSMFFGAENKGIAASVYQQIKQNFHPSSQVTIFNAFSSLELFEIIFSSEPTETTQSQAELEVNLFKALLVLNSNFTSKQQIAFESTNGLDSDLLIPMRMFCMSYYTSDKENYNIYEVWVSQFIKAIYLFEFLESSQPTKPLLSAFLTYFNCGTWEEYLKRLLPLTFSMIKQEREAHTDIVIPPGENFDSDCAFIEKLMITEEDDMELDDFLALRAKPMYKVSPGVYRIIFGLFAVEKIFKGVYFLMRDINKNLPNTNKISNLKSLFGDEFSEKILFYEIIKVIYPNNCISFSGQQLGDMKIDGAPDYYIRRGKDILLFESKDFLIPASVKESFDYAQYENEFEKKLYFVEENGKEKPKAVMQLINSVKKILTMQFQADKDYRYREVSIYPILLTHDYQYDTFGFNQLIDYWFQAELDILRNEGLYVHRVQPLTVVNIDSLIYHQMTLQKYVSLHEMLKMYHRDALNTRMKKFQSVKEKEAYIRQRKMNPFSVFLENYVFANNLQELPPMLENKGFTLFKNQ